MVKIRIIETISNRFGSQSTTKVYDLNKEKVILLLTSSEMSYTAKIDLLDES